jgi:polyhydroxybutyrate depolymerase
MRSHLLFVGLCLLISGLVSAPSAPAFAAAATCPTPATPFPAGRSVQTITVDGMERRYVIYVPPTYDATLPTPLVFSIHGFASNPEQQEGFARWASLADKEALIAVYPQGTGLPARWNSGNSNFVGTSTIDDVGLFRTLITTISERLCIDPLRVYANGLSNGGGMSNRLACEASDVIAAIGGVAGAYSPVTCDLTRPVPIIAFHGTADQIVAITGAPDLQLPAVETWAKDWAERNGCSLSPKQIAPLGDASGVHYSDCRQNADVILYTIEGGGHTWPGGPFGGFLGKTSTDIDATEVMWAFFKQHPLK